MSTILADTQKTLDPDTRRRLAAELKIDESQVDALLQNALPLLTEAMAEDPKAATAVVALSNTIEEEEKTGEAKRGMFGKYLTKEHAAEGEEMIEDLLGARRSAVELGLGIATGMGPTAVHAALPILAPVLMRGLSKVKQERGLDMKSFTAMLGKETQGWTEKLTTHGTALKAQWEEKWKVSSAQLQEKWKESSTQLQEKFKGSQAEDLLKKGTKAFTSFFKR